MAKEKDPALEDDFEFDDSFFSDLDSFDSDLDSFDMDNEPIDSEKDRLPRNKMSNVTQALNTVGKAAGAGAAAGIAQKIDKELPGVSELASGAMSAASEVLRMKNDVQQQIRPVINQTKLISKQLLKYADELIPDRVSKKLEKMLETEDTSGSITPSKEEARENVLNESLENIFKVQQVQSAQQREYKRQEAVERLIDQRMTQSRHSELVGLVGTISNQSMFSTNFIRSTFTAYLKKDLELKYRHLYLAEDTLESIRVTAQMLEERLDAIRHNTSLPDAQKIHIDEMFAQKAKERLIGGFQNWTGKILNKVKENYINPAIEGLGTMNELGESALQMLLMEESFGGKFDAKKSLMGMAGGYLGGAIGAIGGRKLINAIPPEAKKTLNRYAKMGPLGIKLFLDRLRRGEIEFEGSNSVADFLDSILPEIDRTAGKFGNDVYENIGEPGAITKKFTTTVEEIIPGYLSIQTALLEKIATGKDAERKVYDFESRKFVTTGALTEKIFTQAYGTEDERSAILKANADTMREALQFKGRSTLVAFEDVAKEVSIFMMNLANSNAWPYIDLKELKLLAENGSLDSEYLKVGFRGIKNAQEVAKLLVNFFTFSDGSENYDIVSAVEERIQELMLRVSDKHKTVFFDAINKYGYAGSISEIIDTDEDGNFVINANKRNEAYDKITKEALESSKRYYDKDGKIINSLGGIDDEKTYLEKGAEKLKNIKVGKYAKAGAQAIVKAADSGITKLAEKYGKEKEYEEFKEMLRRNYATVCKFIEDRKIEIKKFKDDIKATFIKKTFNWLDKRSDYTAIKHLLFDETGQLKENISPVELSSLLARIPGLHSILHRIHKADNPIYYVIDSMLPHSAIMVAEMTEEEMKEIFNSDNPTEALTEAIEETPKSTKKQKKNKSAAEQAVDEKLEEAIEPDIVADVEQEKPKRGRKKKKDETLSTKEMIEIKNQAIEDATNEQKPKRGRKKKEDIPTNKRKANGGTIDSLTGNAIGTINKPTLIANGNALAGEHGVETVVPHNKTIAAREAYLQAKAYHEGNLFADGGPVNAKGKKKKVSKEIQDAAKNFDKNQNKKGFLSRIGKLFDELVSDGSEKISDTIKNIDFKDDEANAVRDEISKAVSGVKTNTEEKLGSVQSSIENAYKDLKKIKPKDGFVTISGKLIKFIALTRKDGVIEQLTPADRRLIKRIAKALKDKDYGLESIKRIPDSTSDILKYVVKRYQEAYVTSKETTDEYREKVSGLFKSAKSKTSEYLDEFRESEIYKSIESGVESTKETTKTIKDKTLGFANSIISSVTHFFENKTGTLVDIAEQQLYIQKRILAHLNPSLLASGNLNFGDEDIDDIELKQNTKKDRWYKRGLKFAGKGVGKIVKGLGYDLPKGMVFTTVGTARHAVSNRVTSVYRKPEEGESLSRSLLLISKEQFKEGVYHDPEGKRKVKSVADINGPVYDNNGNVLIDEDDYAQGLVDEKNRPIKTIGSRVGRFGRNLVTGTAGKIYGAASGIYDVAKKSKIGRVVGTVVTAPISFTKALMTKFVDVYKKDNLKEPLITARDQERGLLFFEDGKPLKDSYSIRKPVVWGNIKENGKRRNKIAISWDDIEDGLVDKKNKPLNKFSRLAGGLLGRLGRGIGNLAGKLGGGLGGLVTGLVTSTIQFFTKKKDPFIDVYVPNKKGEFKKGRPRLVGKLIKAGQYVFEDGKPVRSAYGIDRPVLDRETGKVLISEDEIEKLVDIEGKRLTKFAGRSLLGKAIYGTAALAGKAVSLAWKGIKGAGKVAWNGLKTLFGKKSGKEATDHTMTAISEIFKSAFSSDRVKRQDLIEIVGNRLVSIYELLVARLPKPQEGIMGDSDNDGIRDGSYQDYLKDKEARKKAKEEKEKKRKGKGKAGATGAVAGAAASDEENGGLIDGAADAKAAWDMLKESKVGKWVGNKFGMAKNFLGKKFGLAKTALKGAASLGASKLAASALGTKVAAGLTAASGALSTAGSALAAGVGTTAGAVGSALGAAGTFLVSNPIGWAIGAGILAYSGYKFVSWMFSDSDYVKEWKKLRYEAYGLTDKYASVIEDLEEETMERLRGKKGAITDSEVEDWAEEFGLIDTGHLFGMMGGDDKKLVKEKIDYFASWYAGRFYPIYKLYAEMIVRLTGEDLEDIDPDDISDRMQKPALEAFKQQINKIINNKDVKFLVPTEEGYKAFLDKKNEAEKKKESDSTKIAAGGAAAVAAVEQSKPKKDAKSGVEEAAKKKDQAIKDDIDTIMGRTPDKPKKEEKKDGFFMSILKTVTGVYAIQKIASWTGIDKILANTKYKISRFFTGEDDYEKKWCEVKHYLYGSTPDQDSLIGSLENFTIGILEDGDDEPNDARFMKWAAEFGLYSFSDSISGLGNKEQAELNKKKIEYFIAWYTLRFRPVFAAFVNIYRKATETEEGDPLDLRKLSPEQSKDLLALFKVEAEKALAEKQGKRFVPSLSGFNSYEKTGTATDPSKKDFKELDEHNEKRLNEASTKHAKALLETERSTKWKKMDSRFDSGSKIGNAATNTLYRGKAAKKKPGIDQKTDEQQSTTAIPKTGSTKPINPDQVSAKSKEKISLKSLDRSYLKDETYQATVDSILVPEAKAMVENNITLQEAIWRRIKSQGQEKTIAAFNSTYKQGITPTQWLIEAYYMLREEYDPLNSDSSNERYRMNVELKNLLDLSSEESKSKPKNNDEDVLKSILKKAAPESFGSRMIKNISTALKESSIGKALSYLHEKVSNSPIAKGIETVKEGVASAGKAVTNAVTTGAKFLMPSFSTSDIQASDIKDGGSGDLGTYIKKFESGTRGSAAIGYDGNGGTSYGTYQFSSRVGALKEFLEWAKSNGGKVGMELAKAMLGAGMLNTGSRNGTAPDIWRQFASIAGNPLGKLERAYIHKKYYQAALKKITNPQAQTLVNTDRGLQEALWSTAVQHGVGGAGKIFNSTYREGITAEEWLKAIYQKRGTQFTSSSSAIQRSAINRFKAELPIVLGLSKTSGSGNIEKTETTAEETNVPTSTADAAEARNQALAEATMPTQSVPQSAPMPSNETGTSSTLSSGNSAGSEIPPEDAAENAEFAKAAGKDDVTRPTSSDVVTSPFGPRNVKGGSKNHQGIDLRARKNEPIFAMKDGKVTMAGGSYGTVNVSHGGNLATRYMHLNKFNVRYGQQVKAGDIIGFSGGRGPSGPNQYTPHLHFDVFKGNKRIDPESFLKTAGIPLKRKGEEGNESMAPQSDAGAIPQTGNEQSAEALKVQQAKAGNEDAKAVTSTTEMNNTDTNSQTVTDSIARAADTKNAVIDKAISEVEAKRESSSTSSQDAIASINSTITDSLASESKNKVITETPSQTGTIGQDASSDAQLQELKIISELLSNIRSDMEGYFKPTNTNTDKPRTESVEDMSKKLKSSTKSTTSSELNEKDIMKIINGAFGPNSVVANAIATAITNAVQQDKTGGIARPVGIRKNETVNIRNGLNISKKSFA